MMLWGMELTDDRLSAAERAFLAPFIGGERPSVVEIWRQLDRVWLDMGLDRGYTDDALACYYAHPVWLLNGIFTACDPESIGHREAIAAWMANQGLGRVADYGGGFGQLAHEIARCSPDVEVDVIEPFPSPTGKSRILGLPRARLTGVLGSGYDAVVAQDVLEHVADPVRLALDLAEAAAPNGHVLFANAFHSCIRCHLPGNFHLRHTFAWVVAPLGLRAIGRVPGADHVQIFRRLPCSPNLAATRRRERVSRVLGPLLNGVHAFAFAALSFLRGFVRARDTH